MKKKQTNLAWGEIALINAMSNPHNPTNWTAILKKPTTTPSVPSTGSGTVKSKFDSDLEQQRYNVLCQWQTEGKIKNLVHHPPVFVLQEGFYHPSRKRKVEAVTWECDFIYTQTVAGIEVIEDIKGKYIFKNFKTKLPFILYYLRDKHVFIHGDVNGWYIPEGKKSR